MLNNTDRTAWLVGLVGALVLGMPAVGSGQGTVADDRAALEALYDATNGANWSRNDNWKTDEPLGQWFGVRTNSDGRVTRLELVDNRLSGTIPVEIGNLTSLFALSLGGNQLSGTIPVEIGNLTSLTALFLGGSQLSGTIPVEIGNLTSLRSLGLNDNQLSGQIPAALGNLTSLSRLRIDTTTGLCLAPDFDLTSPFATQSGLSVCAALTPKAREVVQAAVNHAIAAATDGEGLRTGGSSVTVPLDALFTFPSSVASAVTYAGTTFSVSSTAPGVVSVSTTDVGPGVVLTPGSDAGTAAVTVDARPEGQPAATPVASVMFEVESRLRNSWGWRLGAVLNSPGKHPFALDRRLDAGSGGPAARREVEVGLFRRVADRASEHRWVTDAGRAPRGVAGGALVMSPGVRAGRR